MSPRLREDVRAGKVNGLSRPSRAFGHRVKIPQRRSMPLLAAGAGLYVVCLAVPVFLHEVNPFIVAGAFAGTLFVLLGLRHRWTRPATLPD